MDNWYALQVMTGKEPDVAQALCRAGIRAIAPACIRWERVGGQWTTVARRAIPGYVFVKCRMTTLLYYHLSSKLHVIRVLGMGADAWTAIPADQSWLIEAINGVFGHRGTEDSSGVKHADGSIEVTGGPLVALSDKIVKIDARRRRATVEVQLYADTYQIDMGITVINEAGTTDETDNYPADAEG